MSVKTLAVTGGTGFVGQAVLGLAVAEGYRVRALARSLQPSKPGIEWIAGALGQPDALATLVSGADAVIHVAGVVNAPDRAGFEAGNIAGTQAIVDAARAAGVTRLVHVSSLTAREPLLSVYGWSKAESERVITASSLDWSIVRPPAIYGPGDREMLDLFRFARRGVVPLPPTGRTSLIEVTDLARLLLLLASEVHTSRTLFEADDGREGGWSHVEFGKAIGRAVGRTVIALSLPRPVLQLASSLDRLFRGSGAKLTSDRVGYLTHPDWVIDPVRRPPPTFWQPVVDTGEGLRLTAQAYETAGWL
jgi:uncharacterized protein YbjT (DUF2867 family)